MGEAEIARRKVEAPPRESRAFGRKPDREKRGQLAEGAVRAMAVKSRGLTRRRRGTITDRRTIPASATC